MEGFSPAPDAGAWEAFAPKLGEAEMADADELLRQRLDGFEVAAQPGSWEAMQQRIEADEAAEMIEQEVNLDSLAQEKLSDFRVPFQSKHWALMAQRLEAEFTLLKQIHRFKLAEIGIVALLMLTFVRFLPLAEEFARPSAELDKKEAQPPHQEAAPTIHPENVLEQNTEGQLPEGEVMGTPIAASPVGNPGVDFVPGESENAAGNQSPETKHLTSVLAEGRNRNEQNEAPAKIGQPTMGIVSKQPEAHGPLEKFAEQNQRNAKLIAAKLQGKPENLSTLPTEKVKSRFAWEALPTLNADISKIDKTLRFSIFTTNDVNFVTTPADQLNVFDTLVNTAAHNTLAAGYGGGVLVSWKRNKVEYQMGGIYSFKRYMPNTPVFLFETLDYYVREDFKGIQLDVLQVPLSVNYHFKDQGQWRFYGSAGVGGHFVTTSVYEIEQEQTESLSLLPPPGFDPLNPSSSPEDIRTIRNEKDFPDGLFDGGHLRDNFYLTVNAGIGVERYISSKWVVFLQPNYQHYMLTNGIGTNNDKIYTTSIFLGTKFSLK